MFPRRPKCHRWQLTAINHSRHRDQNGHHQKCSEKIPTPMPVPSPTTSMRLRNYNLGLHVVATPSILQDVRGDPHFRRRPGDGPDVYTKKTSLCGPLWSKLRTHALWHNSVGDCKNHWPSSPYLTPPSTTARTRCGHASPYYTRPSPLSPLTPSHHLTLPLNISLSPPFPPTLQPGVWSTAARPNPAHPHPDPSCGPLPPPHLAHTRVYFHTRSHHS